MNIFNKKSTLLVAVLFFALTGKAQLQVTDMTTAQALAQRLVGEGVTISNVSFTGDQLMAGYFKNLSQTHPELDSGIVLTTGLAKTNGFDLGVDGDASEDADNSMGGVGDADLAAAIGGNPDLHDRCVLEFDFVPLGDSIKFRYAFSSEEYRPSFVCGSYNDAFAFFISGPGFPTLTNIALIPGTSLPVSIHNVNNVQFSGSCILNPGYYQDNTGNAFLTHDGITKVLTALAQVQPCQVYHLKLVIADNFDELYDSGVFLEAKSLTSNAFQLTNLTQTDNAGASYLVEGCATGALKIRRQEATLFSQTINLGYAGTATNGVDVQLLPSTITIPANQTEVLLNINPIIDNVPEGIETLVIYTLAPCGVLTPTDSARIQIRDYDTLGVTTSTLQDTAVICRNGSAQLFATGVYSNYQWEANPGLSNVNILNPVATPAADSTTFICTAQEGTCHARDSVFLYWKKLKLQSKTNVNCHGATTGQVSVTAGPEWASPVEFAINGNAYQPGNSFTNLPVGTHVVKARDAAGCIDSISVAVDQAFPDLLITDTTLTNGSCTGGADATINVTASGGKAPLLFSSDGTTFQPGNVLTLAPGTYDITVKDANGCLNTLLNAVVGFDNTMLLSTGAAPTICEGKNTTLPASTNGTSVSWTPSTALSSTTTTNPVASPTTTTKYYIKSILGICDKTDSVTVFVNPAPTPDAGKDSTICYGGSTQLTGSGGVVYSWTPSTYLSSTTVSDPLVSRPATTTYFLTVTDVNGCVSLSTDKVVITVARPAKLYSGRDTIVAMNQPLQLNAIDVNGTGFTTWSWSPSNALNNPFIPNPIGVFTDYINELIVTASTASNCIGLDTIKVTTYKGPEIYVPNAFVPDGSSNNVLRAIPVGIKDFRYFRIYNRFGEIVFTTNNATNGWDGRLKGYLQQTGTYVWIAEGIDYRGRLVQRKGTTTIVH